MTRLGSLVLVLAGAVALATGACTTTTTNNNHQLDGGTGRDAVVQFDSGPQQDGGSVVGCTKTGITATVESADFDATNNAFFYYGMTSETAPMDALGVEMYFDYGNPKPTIGPGTYTLGATTEEQSYATCGTCVVVYAGCGDSGCSKYYFAESGTLTITSLDNTAGFVASLTNAKLVEITIDSSTGASTPVPGGATWCFPSYSMDLALTTPLPCTGNPECTGTPETPYCNTEYGVCVACLEENHCASLTATPHCDVDYGECVECVEDTHCTSNSNGALCYGGLCGACKGPFDCHDAAKPVCTLNETSYRAECVVGGVCTGDDAGEPGDDGPAGARTLTIGTALPGNICEVTLETDFYKVVTAATGNLTASLTWTDAAIDLDLYVYDSTGAFIDSSEQVDTTSETVALTAQPAGTYFIEVYAYTAATTAAYSLTVTTP